MTTEIRGQKVWRRTIMLGSPGSFQRAVNQSRRPVFGPSLPIVEGYGGWPVEEPTREDLAVFLKCLSEVPSEYLSGYKNPSSPDYGTLYFSCNIVIQWLELIKDAELLASSSAEF